jgi:hypothetical protein
MLTERWREVGNDGSPGGTRSTSVPESLIGVAWPKLRQALGVLSFSCCIDVGRPRRGRCSAGGSHTASSPPLRVRLASFGLNEDAGFAGTSHPQ